MLTFLYAISELIRLACYYVNQSKQLSQSIRIAMTFPKIVFYALFLIWIITALLRSLAYLKSKRIEYKYLVMKQLTIVIMIEVICTIVIQGV